MTDLLEQMRQEENLAHIAMLKTDLIRAINEEPYRLREKYYKQHIQHLFDIIDDYERGDRDAAIKKLDDIYEAIDGC